MSKETSPCRTRNGTLAAWERGGGMTSTGRATLYAGAEGEPLEAIKVNTSGQLAGRNHALVGVDAGCWEASASRSRGYTRVNVRDIEGWSVTPRGALKFEYNEKVFTVEFDGDAIIEEESDMPDFLLPLCRAARGKANEYHCRRAWYIAKKGEGPRHGARISDQEFSRAHARAVAEEKAEAERLRVHWAQQKADQAARAKVDAVRRAEEDRNRTLAEIRRRVEEYRGRGFVITTDRIKDPDGVTVEWPEGSPAEREFSLSQAYYAYNRRRDEREYIAQRKKEEEEKERAAQNRSGVSGGFGAGGFAALGNWGK